eukprot:117890-Rhodomonas_salina.1
MVVQGAIVGLVLHDQVTTMSYARICIYLSEYCYECSCIYLSEYWYECICSPMPVRTRVYLHICAGTGMRVS